jgi:hypothetical protein
MAPVAGFKADQFPLVTVWPAKGPPPPSVNGDWLLLASAT